MKIRHGALLAAGALLSWGCSEPTISDFNNPAESDYQVIASRSQLATQATGIANGDRFTHDFQILLDETIGRNVYRLDGAESRYVTQPLGATISPSIFIGTSVFTGPYRTINSADLLIRGVQEALPAAGLTPAEVSGTVGYAQTFKALQYIRLIEQRDTLGIPIFVNRDSLSPISCKPVVLTYISALLDSAATSLAAGGSSFAFGLPSGFDGFDTPETFAQFNRALAAKVEIYRAFQNYGGDTTTARSRIDQAALTRAQTALDASFLNETGDLEEGVYHTYSLAAGDYSNPNFGSAVYRINPRVVKESEGATFVGLSTSGDSIFTSTDKRVLAKVQPYDQSVGGCRTVGGVTSCYRDNVNQSNTTPLPIIKNAELLLLQAEVYFGQANYAAALAIVNDIRARSGGFTTPLVGLTDRRLLREILRQKRYELLFQSPSRFVDFRMFGLLDELGKERGNNPVPVFPFPVAEQLARGGNLAKVCTQ